MSYLRIAAESPARLIVGVHLNQVAVAARELTTGLPDVAIVRGDLLRLPFAAGTFDLIDPLGVLDHTPDPRRLRARRLLRPGMDCHLGCIPCERPIVEAIMGLQRGLEPAPAGACSSPWRLSPIGGLTSPVMSSRSRVVSGRASRSTLATIGVSMHPDPEVRACDTLDWYAASVPLAAHRRGSRRAGSPTPGWSTWSTWAASGAFITKARGTEVNLAGRRPISTDPG